MSDAKKGNLFFLQMATFHDGSDYETVAGLRDTDIGHTTELIDTTTKDIPQWQASLEGGGVKAVEITATGIYNAGLGHQRIQDAVDGIHVSYGTVTFAANPTDLDDFVYNSATWTFVTGSPTGNQTTIGADLAATMVQLAADLNASADADIDDATYFAHKTGGSSTFNAIAIRHDIAGVAGDAYTLADGIAGGDNSTPSAATLEGGEDTSKNWNARVIDEDGSTWTGRWTFTSFNRTGNQNDVDTFSLTLSSDGVITHVQA